MIISVWEQEKNLGQFNYDGDKTLLYCLSNIIPYLVAPCGGNGICGKCTIKVIKGEIPITKYDNRIFTKEQLQQGFRLGCKAYPKSDCDIEIGISNEKDFEIISSYKPKNYNIKSPIHKEDITFSREELLNSSFYTLLKTKVKFKYAPQMELLKKIGELLRPSRLELPLNCSVVLAREYILDIVEDSYLNAYSMVIDIGTTTIAMCLLENETGDIIGERKILNPQRMAGSDVISRLQHIEDYGVEDLHNKTISMIENNMLEILNEADVNPVNLYQVIVTGNTVMLHIFAGIQGSSISQVPFACSFLESINIYSKNIFTKMESSALVTLLPNMAPYVGADITSGILYLDMDMENEINLLIDIGTNGEMVIGNKEGLIFTSTAAGPAFEGGNIECGIGSIPGAISSIRFGNGKWYIETIGNKYPKGICGSGIIDVIAEGIKHDIIDSTGYLMGGKDGKVTLFETEDTNIYITQKDIRQVQLGKAAIRAGIERLIETYGCSYDNINNVYIAGGFGYNVSKKNLVNIGLIPKELEDKIVVVGNSALGGAVQYALDESLEYRTDALVGKVEGLNLASDQKFNDVFINSMLF